MSYTLHTYSNNESVPEQYRKEGLEKIQVTDTNPVQA